MCRSICTVPCIDFAVYCQQAQGTQAPVQVLVQESDGGHKAKFTTAYGEPQYNPAPRRQHAQEKTKWERLGGRGCAPVAEMKLVYRDLITLQNRGVVPKNHQPDWLSQRAAAAVAGTQKVRSWTGAEHVPLHLAFQPGEVVDLT